MQKNLKKVANEIEISLLQREAAWTGYDSPYVQNIISAGLKVLKLLSVLTFDLKLLFWTKGLENHLEGRVREAAKEKKELEKLRFKTVKKFE
jgi:hypothetical protein